MEIDDEENELKEILKENPDIEDVNWDEIWGGDDDL